MATTNREAIALDINASVAPDQPAEAAGSLGVIGEVDVYTLNLPMGIQRVLQPLAPCDKAQKFNLLVQTNTGLATEYAFSCSTSIYLPQGEQTISMFSHSGDTGNYSFDILEPATTEVDVIELDTLIEGTLSARERLLACLLACNPARYKRRPCFHFIESVRQLQSTMELTDRNGVIIKSTSACLDLGLVDVDDRAPYALQIVQSAGSTFAFTIAAVDVDTVIGVGPIGNQPFDLTISSPGQTASATFQVSQGERIYVNREGGVLSGMLTVTNPDGIEIVRSAPNEEDVKFEAGSGGTYSLTLSPQDTFTGVVPVTLIRIAGDISTNTNRGETFTLSLSTLGQQAEALFDMVEGDVFTVTEIDNVIVTGLKPVACDIRLQNGYSCYKRHVQSGSRLVG